VRKVVAIFLSAILLCMQALVLTGAQAASTTNCCACSCGLPKCCVAQSKPNSQPVSPAAPRSASQNDTQLLFKPVAETVAIVAPRPQVFRFDSSSFPKITSVPLYQRNCSLLI